MNWRPDRGPHRRITLTMFLLLVLYIAFAGLLAWCFDGLLIMTRFMGVFLFTQLFFSGRIALYSMGVNVIDEDDDPQARKLHVMVGQLPQQTDLSKPGVTIANTHAPDAFVTRHSQRSSAVCVTTDLVETLDDDELESVIIHGLAHMKGHDVMVTAITSFLSSIAFLIVCWGWLFGSDNNHQNAPVIVTIIVSLVVWVISYLPIQALSRYRGYAADHGATVIIDCPSALASALFKISGRADNVPRHDVCDTSGMSALFIIPIKSDFIGRLLSTHPPTEDRIERLYGMECETGAI